jgi:hypothetical protein
LTHFPENVNETHIGYLHPFDQMLNIVQNKFWTPRLSF